ncbi:MAG: polyprenol monophosphomannose synthase [Candidatus Andersenbacteria bacterium]|nr:polyprenol monophosphomannose synthase [Candidatus Andersenbacteria bacterium]MBI3250272.1 polyprenol monophosphomannose synthase [Candidatus Andersenbacteria bacterium]
MPIKNPWVVIPTYNERDNIKRLIESLFSLSIPRLSVLIVDDSSPDKTGEIVASMQKAFPALHLKTRPAKAGLGRAYVAGFRYALDHGADAIVQMDADFSHDPEDLPRLLGALESADVAIGSRYSHGISVVNWPLRRLLISLAGNWYARIVTGIPIHDATGGFKAWKTDTLKAINFETIDANGYGFQIAMNFRAWKTGQKLREIPIIFTERRDGQSKMNGNIVQEALLLAWRLRLTGK